MTNVEFLFPSNHPDAVKSLDELVLPNIESEEGMISLMTSETTAHVDVLKELVHFLPLYSTTSFFNRDENPRNGNLITLVRTKFSDYKDVEYVIRTHLNDENSLVTDLYNNNPLFCTFDPQAINQYTHSEIDIREVIRRVPVPRLDYCGFPRNLRIAGIKEVLALSLDVGLNSIFQQEDFENVVGSYFQLCEELEDEMEE